MKALLVSFLLVLGASASAAAQDGQRVFYPAAAQEQGVGGRVTLECPIDEEGRLDCAVTEEAPANMGFGAAALRMVEDWRVAPRTHDGVSTAGGRIRRTFVFEPGPPPRVSQE
jgi:TonB family protein